MEYEHIYINGDSYTALADNNVYSDFLQEYFPNTSIRNAAIRGSNNDRIFRSSVEHISSLGGKSLVIIGFSFLTRQELWYDGNRKDIIATANDETIRDYPIVRDLPFPIPMITLDKVYKKENTELYKMLMVSENIVKKLIDYYTNLVMLRGFLRDRGIDYIIFSAANNSDLGYENEFIYKTNVYKTVQQDKRIKDVEEFSIPFFAANHELRTTSTGHLLEDGHKEFAKYLHGWINNT